MKCKWSGCDNERRIKSPFCGDTCYKRWMRANSDKLPVINPDKSKSDTAVLGATQTEVAETTPEVLQKTGKNPVSSESSRESKISTPESPTADNEPKTRIASIEDYHAHREDYTERACVELLNWGPWMNTAELSDARLSGNRVSEPGDWDYVS